MSLQRSRRHVRLLSILTLVLALALSVTGFAPAQAAGILAQPISGTVTADGQPLAGVKVDVLDSSQNIVETGTTGENGAYSIPTDAGTYRLRYNAAGYQTEFYNDKFTFAAADPITLTLLSGRSGVDVSLSRPPTLGGTVTGGGKPAVGTEVIASDGTDVLRRTTTDSKGAYAFTVPVGSYTLFFGGNTLLKPEYFDNAASSAAATPVAVGIAGKTVDADLALNPYVAGTVVDAAGAPVEGADVTVTGIGDDATGDDVTDPNGAFRVRLPAGKYAVKVSADGFVTEYYDDAPTAELATPVTLGSANLTLPRSIALATDRAVRGTVKSAAGAPVRATVTAFKRTGDTFTQEAGSTKAAADGTYALTLAPGEYRLKIAAPGFVTEFFDDASTIDAATTLTVTRAADLSGKDVVLAPLPVSLAGTVTQPDAKPLPDADVVAERRVVTGETVTWVKAGDATTDAAGKYAFTELPDGTYRVRFSHSGYVPEYFDNAATAAAATPVTVVAGTPATANASLAVTVGSVAGTVSGAPGPLADIAVAILDDSGAEVASTSTSATGTYSVTVNPGDYRVRFTSADGRFAQEFYDDAATLAGAKTVTVASAAVTGIDAFLAERRPLAGTITGNGGAIYGAVATLHDLTDDHVVATSTTAIDGRYTLYAAPGQYRLDVWGGNYFKGRSQTVTLGANGLVLDVELERNRVVVGGVTLPDGKPAVGATVTGYVLQGGTWVKDNFTTTGSAGEYFLPVTPGTYRVEFDGHDLGLGTSYYKQATSLATATNVPVTSSADVLNIDGALPLATGIKATVTRKGPEAGQADALRLDYYRYDATDDRWEHVTSVDVETDAAGTGSELVDLAPGTYRVKTREVTYGESGDVVGATRYYDEVATFAAAKSVTVTANAVTPIALTYGAAVVVPGTITSKTRPVISGRVALGQTLSVTSGTWTPSGLTYAYQWRRDGASIAGATSPRYATTKADLGHKLSVKVTASKAGFTSASVFAAQTVVVKSLSTLSSSVTVPSRGKVVFGVRVSAKDVDPTGVVTLKRGAATLGKGRVKDGKLTLTITGQPLGRRVYTLIYAGTTKTSSAKINLTVQLG